MANPYPADNPLMRGPFEPIRMECDYADLIVEGEMSGGLKGTPIGLGRTRSSHREAPTIRCKATA